MRLSVRDLRNDTFCGDLGICPDDTRFYKWVNSAQERMLSYGRWYGSIQEAQFCARGCVLCWPREVGAIEQLNILNAGPVPTHNSWYTFSRTLATLNACPGCASGRFDCGHLAMTVRDRNAVSFDVSATSGSTLLFYPGHSSDVGKTILVQGRDSNGVWIRTNPTGTRVIDGELVTLAMPYAATIKTWAAGSPLGIQKQATNYRVLMYELDLATMQQKALGSYQPTETNPFYRTSTIPGLSADCSGSSCSNPCGLTTIQALVKLAHVDVASDEDWLIFHNKEAYKEGMLAVRDWANGDFLSGNAHFFGLPAPKQSRSSNQATLTKGGALPLLRAELRSLSSDRTEVETHYEANDRLVYDLAGFR